MNAALPASMKSIASSSHHADDDGEHNHEGALQMETIIPMVVLSSSDGKGETRVAPQRVSRRRRLPRRHRARAAPFHIPPGMAVVVISSNSEEGTDVDIEAVTQSFDALNVGEKGTGENHQVTSSSTSIVTVEVQTEISIPPKVFLEPSIFNMVLNRTCGDLANRSKQSANPVASIHALDQPMEDTTLMLKKIASKKKVIFSQTYEEGAASSAPSKTVSPYKAATQESVMPMHAKPILVHQVEPLSLPDDTPSSAAPSSPCEPHCPPSRNTRSKAKGV